MGAPLTKSNQFTLGRQCSDAKLRDVLQSDTSPHYAGLDKLWIGEESLRRYNEDLVHQFTRAVPSAPAVLEFGAGIGTLATVWESITAVKPDCLEIDPRQRAVLEQRGFHCYARLDRKSTRLNSSHT